MTITLTPIPGVVLKQLTTHFDDRGFFREVIRYSDDFFFEGFGQWSHSEKEQGHFEPEFHVHQYQVDWWYIPYGLMNVVLFDDRQDSDGKFHQFLMGKGQLAQVLRIPPGVAHNYKVLDGPAGLMYITSMVYNPNDEGRLKLDFDWNKI